MAFNGRDKSSKKEESIPLTSDQDVSRSQSSTTRDLLGEIVEGTTSTMFLRSINTEPVISRDYSSNVTDGNVTILSFLHDEVDKLFEKNWRQDNELMTDPNKPAVTSLTREPSKVALTECFQLDETEYSRHRRVSYPHIHQPLRSLSNKSLTKSSKSAKSKKKSRRKKKKEKLRAFPSRSALQSPPIPEEEEHDHYLVEEDDDSTSTSDEDDYDSETPTSRNNTTTNLNGESQVPQVVTTSATPSPSSSPIKMLVEDSQSHDGGEDVAKDIDRYDSQPTEQVGFYIGLDSPSNTDVEETKDNVQAPLITERSNSVMSGTDEENDLLIVEEDEQRSEVRHFYQLGTDEPVLSERAGPYSSNSPKISREPGRKLSTGGKVTFLVGGDSAYPSTASMHSSVDSSLGLPAVTSKDDKDVENEGKKKAPRRRGSSEGDKDLKIGSGDHNLLRVPSVEGSQSNRSAKRRHHHHHQHFKQEDLIMRRQKGSELKLHDEYQKSPTEADEARTLQKSDLDTMTSHRFEEMRGIRRHMIAKSKISLGKTHHEKKQKPVKKFDHSPHEMFVELDELHFGDDDMVEWREKARWIKFEEDVEEGAERWGKPHVASLSFHSLLELRRGLEDGTFLLDLEATDLSSIIHNIVENMVIRDLVDEDNKGKLLRTLLLKHRHVSGRSAFLRRTPSYSNLTALDGKRHISERGLLNTLSQTTLGSSLGLNKSPSGTSIDKKKGPAKLEMVKVDVDNNMTDKHSDGSHIGVVPVEQKRHVQDIMRRIPKGSEASTVLVGQVDFLHKPAMAFVRLSEGRMLENLTEVPLPVRFIFVLLGPEKSGMDYHEVGRSLSTLMSNQTFHGVAYRAESREDILRAINGFLDDSIVLPPGDWDHRTLLPITLMARRRAKVRQRKKQQLEEEKVHRKHIARRKSVLLDKKDEPPADPLRRTGCLFGGLVNDIKRRYPFYLSDLTDAKNGQSIAALFFIFFTCLSPCIAFGGLLSEKTHQLMGVSETMIATSVFGMMFSLFCGQPLLIIGSTGPVLVFEESLYKFCSSYELEFLPVRFWIGLWVCVITILAVALEGSFLIRHVTRFTEEIFAILISLIFIYEVIKKLKEIFASHPLMEDYCFAELTTNKTEVNVTSVTPYWLTNSSDFESHNDTGLTLFPSHSISRYTEEHYTSVENKPNTALLSLILVFGTFLVAYFLRVLRNSKFLGRRVRRALGDFGVLIALVCMVVVSLVMHRTYVQKLDLTDPMTPTSSERGWFINPMGIQHATPVWIIFASILPAFLIFILLFMETQITQMILNKKERKLQKGSGYHLDQFILGLLTLLGGLFGLPWMCAATVRTVAHVNALSIYSSTHAPGEKPQLLGVKEQRVTNFAVHLLIGLSICLGPVLRAIPVPALFGVFLYLGVSAMSGVQMFERMKLLLMPVKYHPSFGYVRKVPTIKMHKYTLIQLGCLIALIIIKSTPVALFFPLFLILLVPLRSRIVPHFFTNSELEELDKEEEEFELDEEDDPDFYQQAHMPI